MAYKIKLRAKKTMKDIKKLPYYSGSRKVLHPGSGTAIERLTTTKLDTPEKFLSAESYGTYLRHVKKLDPEEAKRERLKKRITLPKLRFMSDE